MWLAKYLFWVQLGKDRVMKALAKMVLAPFTDY